MPNNYSFSYVENASSEQEHVLLEGIIAEATARGMDRITPFSFLIKNDQGKVLGGVKGASLYGCLYVDLLWVDPSLRHQGLGTKLMKESEKLGKERNCSFALVTTMDWEALPLYQKLGYEIEFVREGYQKKSKMFVLRKPLT